MNIDLYPHQMRAIKEIQNGSVLKGGTGSGKSRTAVGYYYMVVCGGRILVNGRGTERDMTHPKDLYIITTAMKRDSFEWVGECLNYGLTMNSETNPGKVKITIDSWNNIKKYLYVEDAFFIFDEQRAVNYGTWGRTFIKISRKNSWIMLTATPGDNWNDYISVFIANGFYRNKYEFDKNHAVFNYIKGRKVPDKSRYLNVDILKKYRDEIVIPMDFDRPTIQAHSDVRVAYDKEMYKQVWKDRWDPFDNVPVKEITKLFYLMRKVVNSDETRIRAMLDILEEHKKVIIFYNFTYELEAIREALDEHGIPYSEWNGERHEAILDGSEWAYLVQYTAGAEGWNCITTNTMIFFSQSYSYKATVQAAGRIDRLNTPYTGLIYYHFVSAAPIDLAIQKALKKKKNFNEKTSSLA